MSGSENGSAEQQQQRQAVSPSRARGARSMSPAKRSAADMEGGEKAVPGKEVEDGAADSDTAMAGNEGVDTQDTTPGTSAQNSMTTDTPPTSFQSDAPPPYSAEDNSPPQLKTNTDYSTADIDVQESTVRRKQQKELDEGQKGVVVSTKWLARVLSRSSQGLKDSTYPKDVREGLIGPVDNSDIVPEGAFTNPLHDMEGRAFIPLKPGLAIGQDYEVFNNEAWGTIVASYGVAAGQKQIERYVRNTADGGAQNLMYDVYPPVFTIRKVPQPREDEEHERPQSSSSAERLRLKQEQRGRGQNSPDDAIKLVSSRQERFQKFLQRSKEAAGIPRTTKVKVWKMLDPSQVSSDNRQNGVMSPPASRSTSPKEDPAPNAKLIVDLDSFNKMEIGKELEPIDAKDETNNSNYNGTSNMELYVLVEDAVLLLEEQIGGSAGGEFASDKKKSVNKFGIGKKNAGSRPGSAPASGRTSPAPGGMITRGRARRDGHTRGTVGLANLGNTCYMNSALQCIRSVEELAVYFLSDKYKPEINASNPLGHGGVMAKQYANLLRSIYADNAGGSVTPSAFKKTLGNMQPMFSGYGQQDSQEFLSFLVDALHEDLNRILKKPYNENPDSDDNTVHDPQAIIDLGETYRNNHKARNDSVAMDLFSGFYKNTMECPECDKISITFDPFSLLTVQLPAENTFQHTVTFVPLRGRPVNHAIDIDKNASIKTLKENIAAKHPGVKADRLFMAEVYSHKIYKVFDDKSTVAEAGIGAHDYIFAFELEDAPSNPPLPEKKFYTGYGMSSRNNDKVPDMDDPKADHFVVPIFSRQKNRYGSGRDMVMHPMYIIVTREEAKDFDIILKKVLIAASRMTSSPMLTELSEEVGEGSEMEKDEPAAADENFQVNDTSSSEDGYVKVSVGGSEAPQTNGTSKTEDDRPIPPRFMDPEYFVSPALRNQLFAINYAPSGEGGMHCSGMQSIKDNSIHNMFDRVKQTERRGSTESASSEDESTTSTGSGGQANGGSEESEDESDKPDITLGGESHSGLQTPAADSDSESLPDNPVDPTMSRKGRRKNNKHGKKGRRNIKTYGKKGRGKYQGRPDSSASMQSQRSFGGKFGREDDDNPYYIKLGEGIVLDWYPDALDSLFNGDPDDEDSQRGHFVSHPEGKGLPFVKDPEVEAKKSRRETRKKNGVGLDDCFNETGKREVLSEDNAWYCNRCKEMRRAAKTLEIWTMPEILVVHLKRFGGNRSFRDKIDVFVDYPLEGLDMTQRVGLKEDGKEYIYDLFAVDNHFGGLGGGHYTALAKNFYDGQWYDYNDSSCSKASEARVHSPAAYLLFYRRRSDKPLGPQYLQDLVLESRNPPPPTEPAADETADESDAGEGRLGGPNGSLLNGSSSGLTGAGAAAEGRRVGDGSASAGPPAAGSSLTTTTMNLDGSPANEYGNTGGSWNFDGLDSSGAAANGDAERLIVNIDSVHEDDDAASTTAAVGKSRESGGYTTPVEDRDSHFMSSNGVQHLEDAGSSYDDTPPLYPDPPDYYYDDHHHHMD